MPDLIHRLLDHSVANFPDKPALSFKNHTLTYAQLNKAIAEAASAIRHAGLNPTERLAVYLPKQVETVTAIFGTSQAGGVFVPVNPLLKPSQVKYILDDCNVRILVTSRQRFNLLKDYLVDCADLHTVILVDSPAEDIGVGHLRIQYWSELCAQPHSLLPEPAPTDSHMAAILYTSGSTGNPKGVVLSHRNMFVGAQSVSSYLNNTCDDRILAVLPFSFDYGLSQLTTAFYVGAHCILMDYLLPQDVMKAVHKHQITGLAAVPPLWSQLARLPWNDGMGHSLRYFTNSGGAMPEATLIQLRNHFKNANPFLMYGLTEAFRSTYLPPDQVDLRPTSMGKAIPNAEILIVREDGSECAAHEPGELVHKGPLVSLGYWNAPEKTAERFKPAPKTLNGLVLTEICVWSGDTVKRDEDGYLYFIGRKDDMIKSSGYRISPTEVEEVIYSTDRVTEAAAIGIPHDTLGQAVVAVLTPKPGVDIDQAAIIQHCKQSLPNFMVPLEVIVTQEMPHNPNGKINRKELLEKYNDLFKESQS